MSSGLSTYGSGRERIMRAVTQVVFENGLRGLTFRAVAESAAVSNSLIVHHFGTRQQLLEATLQWTLGESIGLSQLPRFLNNPEEYAKALFELLSADLPSIVFQYQMILESRRKSGITEPVKLLYQNYVAELAGANQLQSASRIDEDTARYIFATLDGLVLQYVAGVDEEKIHRALLAFWKSTINRFDGLQPKQSVLFLQHPELLGNERT